MGGKTRIFLGCQIYVNLPNLVRCRLKTAVFQASPRQMTALWWWQEIQFIPLRGEQLHAIPPGSSVRIRKTLDHHQRTKELQTAVYSVLVLQRTSQIGRSSLQIYKVPSSSSVRSVQYVLHSTYSPAYPGKGHGIARDTPLQRHHAVSTEGKPPSAVHVHSDTIATVCSRLAAMQLCTPNQANVFSFSDTQYCYVLSSVRGVLRIPKPGIQAAPPYYIRPMNYS